MTKKATAKRLVLICAWLASAQAQSQAESMPEIDCLIEPNMVIELSSPVSGVLDTIAVDRSDAVTEGQVVATLQSDVEEVKLRASRETLNLSKVEQKRAIELYRDNAITLSEKEQSDHDVAINKLEVESAQASLELRRIRSPIDGVVADRYLMPGEFIEDNPLLKIAQLNPLRVEVVAPVTYFGRIKPGHHAQVKTEFGSFDNLIAEVVVVDKVIDAASGTFGIRLELPNEDYQIPGGLKCSARFFDEHEEAEYAGFQADQSETETLAAPVIDELDDLEQGSMSICRKIGPFNEQDTLLLLMAALENDINGYEVRDEASTKTTYRVATDEISTREAAKQREAEMKQAGVKDVGVIKSTTGYRVSLGLFSKEQSAEKRQASMKKLGYDSNIVPLKLSKPKYWAEVIAEKSEAELLDLVATAGIKDTNNLLYQTCTTEALASSSEP
jgi:RND family efflux transporter MFP subunit